MGDKKEILDLFQFQQSEIIAPGCSVLDANWANNVKGRGKWDVWIWLPREKPADLSRPDQRFIPSPSLAPHVSFQ